jgi:hypothetical protein
MPTPKKKIMGKGESAVSVGVRMIRSGKAAGYSAMRGTSKAGAKLQPKPNTKAEPKSNVKVKDSTNRDPFAGLTGTVKGKKVSGVKNHPMRSKAVSRKSK